jgi:hypothetical protein
MLTNLDILPTCNIDDTNLVVKQATKGVYYAEISPEIIELEEDTIYYDKWSKIALNGIKIDDVEMELYVNKPSKRISVGNLSSVKNTVVPSVYGINDNENISQNEIREIFVDFREKYSTDKRHLITSAEYRLYVKDGKRELDVIDFHPIEMGSEINFFNIYGMDLIPNEYFIDIKVTNGREKMIYKNVVRFNIISNISERYQ